LQKVLIANRGEIAIRIIRACQELGLKTVAIHSVADRDSLHAKFADESICIGPGASSLSYLHIPSIMSAAEVAGVDAIHPGYGFLSESGEFARICGAYGIKFIGPRPEQIHLLGNKVNARAVAVQAGVPLLPGSLGKVDKDEALAIAREIGFPVIIKAAAGGGGRGMKVVYEESELLRQLAVAEQEALRAFGCGDCFLEKYLAHPRHIEVQIIADEHGNYRHLGERDCSIQRRHQKILEEAPSPALDEATRQKVCGYALALAQRGGYQSLGTVEFLYEAGGLYFMEMNTRVQVEHPVTEMVTGLDLVKEQILIAQGKTLGFTQAEVSCNGHAIECRVNAEDPNSFAPWPGVVSAYHEPGGPGVRVDSMIYTGYRIPSLYDSMIAKVITTGRDRSEAISRMRRALREMKLEGIRTNIPFHLRILDNEEFVRGNISTNFLQEHFLK
jgi:acetyl-CoA carboxylase biotin carboxylase subunit